LSRLIDFPRPPTQRGGTRWRDRKALRLATPGRLRLRHFGDQAAAVVLKAGLETERVWADWCREVVDALDAMQKSNELS
jgi:uncharacterized protein (DUF2336 family)